MKIKTVTAALSAFLALCMSIGSFVIPVFAASEIDGFSGSRYVKYAADKSDLDNFIDGGRAAFDLVLRSNAPEWLSYELSADDRDVSLILSFEFDSFDHYNSQLSELLTFSPNLVYSAEEDLMLLESYSASELLNFLQSLLIAKDCLKEKQLGEFFRIITNEITINANTYTFDQDRISIKPQSETVVKFEALEISTVGKKSGAYSRTITVQIDTAFNEEEHVSAVIKKFKKAGKTSETEITENLKEVSVTFDTKNQNELTEKTMACLSTAVSVFEEQTYVDQATVGVKRTEFIDLTELLRTEDVPFSYSFEVPPYFSNLSAESESVSVTDTAITAQNEPYITFCYERDFKFSSIDITTDFSKLFGKITRTITLSAPTDICIPYHDRIKDELQSHLIRGTSIDIYDDGGSRFYKLSYASWFLKDIEHFTQSILNSSGSLDIEYSWVPFGTSRLQESIALNSILEDVTPADEAYIRYTFPEMFQFTDKTDEIKNASVSGNSVRFSIGSSDAVSFEYRSIYVVRCTLLLLGVLVVLIFVLVIVIKVRRKIRSKKNQNAMKNMPYEEPKNKHEEQEEKEPDSIEDAAAANDPANTENATVNTQENREDIKNNASQSERND